LQPKAVAVTHPPEIKGDKGVQRQYIGAGIKGNSANNGKSSKSEIKKVKKKHS